MSVLSAILRKLTLPVKMKNFITRDYTPPASSPEASPQYVHRQAFKAAVKKIGRDAPKGGQSLGSSGGAGKFAEICAWAEIRSLTSFKQKFETAIALGNFRKIFIVLDNAQFLADNKNNYIDYLNLS
jgi:hypothetical protein